MCKGNAEGEKKHGFCSRFLRKERVITGRDKSCELCGLEASLYCEADDAYLCRRCDRKVHGANFLALRHIRCFLCNTCGNLSRRYLIGESVEVVLPPNINWVTGNLPDNRKCSRLHSNPSLFF
ncbi:hypothetical protein LR48_Vigan05g158600 [Vigna angularis]|uniref:B box-type domain-containing protein n=2 Tax=Phaseolus angularis TaxID=3914 RepID=A0A0L9UMS2_PHAAN|nr:hypothetical protein LR48_Vigan05g158600 [Vigna angularis]BAT92191.1 hypothetical protein VIGAN_07087000 [Vigna angularis var. angularis]